MFDIEYDDMTEEERDEYIERMEQAEAMHDNLMEDIAWERARGIGEIR